MKIKTSKETSTENDSTAIHQIVLFNDDVNSFDHVINLLVKYCEHDVIQAEQCATLVHFKGKCGVKYGYVDELTVISEILSENGLTVEIN